MPPREQAQPLVVAGVSGLSGAARNAERRPPGPIRWRSSLRNTIYDVLSSKKDWVETESETEWDFFWADKG
ncbi:uncharacterized protein HaLaN_12369 [Haematococcus lacustris]|nr:uncharacterized protein HaLaN_12369 [Haematococcus lacustris]